MIWSPKKGFIPSAPRYSRLTRPILITPANNYCSIPMRACARVLARQRLRYDPEPVLPVDILGAYVLLPIPGMGGAA